MVICDIFRDRCHSEYGDLALSSHIGQVACVLIQSWQGILGPLYSIHCYSIVWGAWANKRWEKMGCTRIVL